MDKDKEKLEVEGDKIKASISLDIQVSVMHEAVRKLIDNGTIRSRVIKHKLNKQINSNNPFEKLYALNKIVSDGKGIETIPTEDNVREVMEDTYTYISEEIARRYINKKIEGEVEEFLMDKQEKYMEEVRLNIIKKKRGPENSSTTDKLEKLQKLDARDVASNVMKELRPQTLKEIVGQQRAIKSLISKISSPYPQHIILYGPPGVGKTTAARIALEEARKAAHTTFDDDSKFIEVDGTTLRWDPREITNPLLGSVHDPIYQGSKRDLAETGIPEPKPGLVTDAHGGILFIDEIGELDSILQNKLLKVLEDKRVEFSSAYYDPENETVPGYIKYLFENGAPADFVLIGATTREPGEINPALRSRCTEVYFEPLSTSDIESIVINAAKKLDVKLEKDLAKTISRYTIEGRKAINILADVYGYALYSRKPRGKRITLTMNDLRAVISISRLKPYEDIKGKEAKEVAHIYGLGVSGYMGSTIEIEAEVFKAKKVGSGTIRFNETAGSMAKDSVFNAASVIRRITEKDIKDYDVHVNVVGGGKIDGPSAGAAITLCIISALLNKPLRQDIAVTGEISLRGKIKPVGGIFEKIYGARRKGINTVFIPIDNEDEIPTGLEDIEVNSVSTIEELMEFVF